MCTTLRVVTKASYTGNGAFHVFCPSGASWGGRHHGPGDEQLSRHCVPGRSSHTGDVTFNDFCPSGAGGGGRHHGLEDVPADAAVDCDAVPGCVGTPCGGSMLHLPVWSLALLSAFDAVSVGTVPGYLQLRHRTVCMCESCTMPPVPAHVGEYNQVCKIALKNLSCRQGLPTSACRTLIIGSLCR